MRQFIPLAFLALCGSAMAAASSPDVCEIWFDSDPSTLRTAAVSDGSCRVSIPIAGLQAGLHCVNVRAADSGDGPGALHRSMFFIYPAEADAPDINAAVCEVWFDSDRTTLHTAGLTDGTCRISIPVEAFAPGMHFVNVRTSDAGKGPGGLFRSVFFIPSAEPTGKAPTKCEIWFDSDVDAIQTADITDGICQVSPSLDELSTGLHFVNLRASDSGKGPGRLFRQPFYLVEQERHGELAGCMVWFDSDIESASYTPLGSDAEKMAVSLDTDRLTSGLHFITILPFDSDGMPGAMKRSAFYLSSTDCSSIGGYEYWFDENTAASVTGGPSSAPLHLSLDISSLKPGQHELYLRACNDSGEWGDARPIPFVLPMTLDAGEWEALVRLHAQLTSQGWDSPWDMAKGPSAVHEFEGLRSEDGHITEITVSHADVHGPLPSTPLEFAKLKRLDLSHNELEGNAGIFAGAAELSYLDLSHNRLSEVDPPLPAGIAHTDLTAQRIDATAVIDLTDPDEENLKGQLPTMFTYNSETRGYEMPSFVLTESDAADFSFGMEDSFGVTPSFSGGSFDMALVTGKNTYALPDGSAMSLLRVDADGNCDGTSMHGALRFAMGDANFSGSLTVADIQASILHIYNDYTDKPFNLTAADTYTDRKLNVQDVIRTVSLLLAKDTDELERQRLRAPQAASAHDVAIWTEDGELWMESDMPVAALHLRLDRTVDWTLGEYGLNLTESGSSMVAYSMSGGSVPPGRHRIASNADGVTMLYAEASDERADDLSVGFGNTSTGTDALGDDGETLIYTPDGVRVKECRRGVNVVKRGSKVSKTIITK